jgi:hypothetical protein
MSSSPTWSGIVWLSVGVSGSGIGGRLESSATAYVVIVPTVTAVMVVGRVVTARAPLSADRTLAARQEREISTRV